MTTGDLRYPRLADEAEYPLAGKCPHARGRWLFAWEGGLYAFEPATQMQKDIWLGECLSPGPKVLGGRGLIDKIGTQKARLQALRWRCFECGTVQMP